MENKVWRNDNLKGICKIRVEMMMIEVDNVDYADVKFHGKVEVYIDKKRHEIRCMGYFIATVFDRIQILLVKIEQQTCMIAAQSLILLRPEGE